MDTGSGEGRIYRFMLEKIEHRTNIGRLVYSWIELLSKLSVRIILMRTPLSVCLSLSLSVSLSLSLSLSGLSADKLLFLWFTSTVNSYGDVGTVS